LWLISAKAKAMKQLITTVILLIALAVPAFASEQQQGTITLTIPTVFNLYYDVGNGDYSFSPSESQILTPGSFLQSNPTPGELNIDSNVNGTKLYVGRSHWTPLNHATSDGDFTLRARHHESMGDTQYVVIPDTSLGDPPVQIGIWTNGVSGAKYLVFYRLFDFTVEDDADVYQSTVTFTLTDS